MRNERKTQNRKSYNSHYSIFHNINIYSVCWCCVLDGKGKHFRCCFCCCCFYHRLISLFFRFRARSAIANKYDIHICTMPIPKKKKNRLECANRTYLARTRRTPKRKTVWRNENSSEIPSLWLLIIGSCALLCRTIHDCLIFVVCEGAPAPVCQ